MTRTFTTQAVSMSLALVVTVCTLMALHTLAASEHAAQPSQLAATAATRA